MNISKCAELEKLHQLERISSVLQYSNKDIFLHGHYHNNFYHAVVIIIAQEEREASLLINNGSQVFDSTE